MICPTCKQPIRKKRSIEMSTRFHSHVSYVAQASGMGRDEVYIRTLIMACEIETEGGKPWKYSIVDDVLYPHRTSSATNAEMITAYAALKMLAAENGITTFPERSEL